MSTSFTVSLRKAKKVDQGLDSGVTHVQPFASMFYKKTQAKAKLNLIDP